jgi:solute carrier family 25 (mitochondrial S-adenosylmethionine transporter), member 26
MAGSFPSAAVFWSGYEAGKAVLLPHAHTEGERAVAHAASAALADVCVTVVRNPFEVVKQQMQAGMHASTAAAVRSILSSQGVRGLYAGWASTVAREIPFDAIEFTLYEWLKGARQRHNASANGRGGQGGLVLWENALLGSVAGGVAAAVTTPLDVIKTRLMTQRAGAGGAGRAGGSVGEALRYAGWRDAAVRIVREEGAAALLSGMGPRVAWISVGGAVFIGSFEELRRRLT